MINVILRTGQARNGEVESGKAGQGLIIEKEEE